MDALRYRRLKIFQLLHDPPSKPFHLKPRGTGARRTWIKHTGLANKLFRAFTGAGLKGFARADLAATGADRPISASAWSATARLAPVLYNDAKDRLILHPLAPHAALHVPHPDDRFAADQDTDLVAPADVLDDDRLQQRAVEALRDAAGPDWDDPKSLESAALVLWRRLRDELMTLEVEQSGKAPRDRSFQIGDALWEHMPADTRSPDHSIWDHTRVTAALSFLDVATDRGGKRHAVPPEQEPWLLLVSLWPVGEFIRQSRKAQDLWLSSFLLADLAFHAMLPIVERYGPENIVYPDLRGNPRVDHWLKGTHKEALPAFVEDPSTYAALLPNAFTAIVPHGGAGHLAPFQDVANACAEAVQSRWKVLSELVLGWFAGKASEKGTLGPSERSRLERVWREQHTNVVTARWTAVPWMAPERLTRAMTRFGALPGQDRSELPAPSAEDVQADAARAERLRPWVPRDVWDRYEQARDVFARVDLDLLQNERGFDYALTHHQLRARHAIRKQTAVAPPAAEHPGEKCTLCGRRSALGDWGAPDAKRAAIESRRQHVRKFWSQDWLDPEETGAERLCAVCAFKRFLVRADGDRGNDAINSTWAGQQVSAEGLKKEGGGQVRVPFPSTSAVAAQRFLAAVAKHPALAGAVTAVANAHRQTGLPETQFPHALPALADAYENASCENARYLLRLDPQETVFPRALDAPLARLKADGKHPQADKVKRLQEAISELLRQAGNVLDARANEPGKRFAVIQIDGDGMGKLLLGDAERVATTWRNVIHPKHLERMEGNPDMQQAGWPALLDQRRLMGPSLHAFISRALADFTHRIVPWVVEREYAGRLVYAGGDDVLALAPAEDAVKIAWRLQQLFSAAWVIDTRYDIDTWAWRRPEARVDFDPGAARERFRILDPASSPSTSLAGAPKGPLLAMLGPGVSLSAGITIGHYKSPLRTMLHQAHHLLEEVAKEKMGRSAVALSYCTRSGPKYQVGMRWESEGSRAAEVIDLVAGAFGDGSLPSRLPYKLREATPSLRGALDTDGTAKDTLLTGLLRRELDEKHLAPDVQAAVLTLWRAGFEGDRGDERGHGAERSVDGLLLARALAAGEPEDDE